MKFLIILIFLFIALTSVGAFLLFAIVPLNIYKDEEESVNFDKLVEEGKKYQRIISCNEITEEHK